MTPPTPRRPPRPLVAHTHGDLAGPCVYECDHDLSGYVASAREEDPDRPRYRVLASRRYDHDPGTCSPEDPTHLGHRPWCHAGFELEVHLAPAPGTRFPGACLGTAQAPSPLDPAHARTVVLDWLRTRAEPLPLDVTTADVDLYLEVPPP